MHFIKNYQFPLTDQAKIMDGQLLLEELGLIEFIKDKNTTQREQTDFRCLKSDIYEKNELSHTV